MAANKKQLDDGLFHVIEGAQVVLHSRGVFRQVKVYRRGGDIYAAHSGGFIKLFGMGGTSHPNATWKHLKHEIKELVITANGTPSWKG